MQIINDFQDNNHLKVIKSQITNSDELVICVAFLKNSGLNLLLKSIPKKTVLFIGIDFYITEPNAIRTLFKNGFNVNIVSVDKRSFHPKIYYFKQNKKINIIIGSANLTSGGLETNFETSFLIETEINSNIDNEFKNIIKHYKENSIELKSEFFINQYETKFNIYNSKQKKANKEFEEELKEFHQIDLKLIKQYLKKYYAENENLNYKNRLEYYKTAKKLLNDLTKLEIKSSKQFLKTYEDIAKSFHSSGLLRGKTIFSKEYKTIIKIIDIIKNNKNKDAENLFAMILPLVKSVNKFGINAITEIMNTYNPNNYSIANGRILKSLMNLGFAKFGVANNFQPKDYGKYNEIMKNIAIECNFEDLGEVDHFLSWYYENYVTK